MSKFNLSYNQDINQNLKLIQQCCYNTVCTETYCSNITKCFNHKIATFMILGKYCSRNCSFCSVTNGIPESVDEDEPMRIAEAAKRMGLKHIVITSVTRDDLDDGGATHFAETIKTVKRKIDGVAVEALIPDFKGNRKALDRIIEAGPAIISHNIKTVKSLYRGVRPKANYDRSLALLQYVKNKAPEILTKTGIIVGLGETEEEIYALMDDAVEVGCDIFTIEQYLQPSETHVKVKEYISDSQLKFYEKVGYQKGFRYVVSGDLARSLYCR